MALIAGLFSQTLHYKQFLTSLTADHNQEDTERDSVMGAIDRSNDDDVQSQRPSGMIFYINLTSINDDEILIDINIKYI